MPKHLLFICLSVLISNLIYANDVVIKSIDITGNKITKSNIILRELPFKINDTISIDNLKIEIENAKKNLLNTSLFNFVKIENKFDIENQVHIIINVTERWYIWPYPIFEFADRNFNVWWENKQISRTNYGVQFVIDNFRGRKEILKILFKHGFDQLYGISFLKPYINKQQTIGVFATGSYNFNHEINYMSDNNKTIFLKDNDNYLAKEIKMSGGFIFRPHIKLSHTFMLAYDYISVSDTISSINKNFLIDAETHQKANMFLYNVKYDHRDSKPYPLKGYYIDAEYSLQSINSSIYNQISANFRKYTPITNKIFVANGLKLNYNQNNAYHYNKGLGYGRDYLRGYEYYVIEGNQHVILKNNLKFKVLKKEEKRINFIKNEKFGKYHYAIYLNLFADLAYIYDINKEINNNKMSDKIINGQGIGVDFVTYYDKVFRFEYSINHKNEKYFYIHFMTSI